MRGARALACAWGDRGPLWGSMMRRCQAARRQLQRAIGADAASRLRLGLGAGTAVVCAAGAASLPSPGDSGGSNNASSTGSVVPGGSSGEEKRPKSPSDFGHPRRRATDVLIVLNAVIFALNWLSKDILLVMMAKVNALIAQGQVWRLVTAPFVHHHWFHLAVNLHSLSVLGPTVEMVSGSRRTAVIYLASGVLATVASFVFCPSPSLGASGGVFGLMAAMGVFYMRHKELLGPTSESGLRSLGITLAINVAYSMINKKLDNWGHAGGLLGGALLAYLLGPRLVLGATERGGVALQDQPPLPWLAFATPRPGVHGPGPALLRGKRKQAAGTGRGAGQVDAGAGAEAGTGGAIAESDGSNGTSGRGRRRRGRGPEAERPGGDGGGPEERTNVGTSSQAAG